MLIVCPQLAFLYDEAHEIWQLEALRVRSRLASASENILCSSHLVLLGYYKNINFPFSSNAPVLPVDSLGFRRSSLKYHSFLWCYQVAFLAIYSLLWAIELLPLRHSEILLSRPVLLQRTWFFFVFGVLTDTVTHTVLVLTLFTTWLTKIMSRDAVTL